MDKVRAKMTVERKVEVWQGTRGGGEVAKNVDVVLRPVIGTEGENATFYDATPSGEITLGGVHPSVAEYFETGRDYYVDFTAVLDFE